MAKTKGLGNVAEGLIGTEYKNSEENPESSKNNAEKSKGSKKGLRQRGYYITDEQYREIKRHAYERLTDTSFIVREAIDEYIKGKQ